MAPPSPAGSRTPVVPSVRMATANPTPAGSLTPMEVDHILAVCDTGDQGSLPLGCQERRELAEAFVASGAVREQPWGWEWAGNL